jgi:hypothetical protein
LAGKEVLKYVALLDMSDDQLEWLTRADCIREEWVSENVFFNTVTRAPEAGISQEELGPLGSEAQMLFRQRFEQDLGSVRYVYGDVEERAESEGMTLAEQVRFWEQDELRRMAQEQEGMNTFLGTDGLWHHRDHLGPGLAGHDETTSMNGDFY